MTGTHISDEQARIYRMFRELQTRKQAAQLASIGFSSAARIDNGSWTSPTNRVRGPRRKKLCGIWETAAAALLEQNPGASPKDLLHHLLERLPLFVTSAQRRTIERWIREWRVRHNHQKDISATFFHSAHQGYLGLGALNEQARNSPDLQLLLRCAKFAPLKKRNKAIMALAVLNRIPLMAAARYLKISPTTAKRWTNIFQEGGADALFHTKTVKPAKYVSKPLLSALFRVLHSPPSCYGFARTNWRAIDLKVAMETEGVTTSLWTIRRSLRQAGYRWRKAK